MKYRKATAEIIHFDDSVIFMTASGEPDCGHFGTIFDPRLNKHFICSFVNFEGYDYFSYSEYPKYTCGRVEPPVSGDLICEYVNVNS